jgi:hypothetical protein
MITKEEMEKLYKGIKKPEELATPDRIALITYSGEDVIEELKFLLKKGLISPEEFDAIQKEAESFIKVIKNELECFECFDCLVDAVSFVLEFKNVSKKQEE